MEREVRKYSKEYKQEAVSLALSYGTVNQAAKELGVPGPTLHEWVNKAKYTGNSIIEPNISVITQTDINKVLEENKELKKRLLRLEQEKEILKKAATYFAKELG